LFYATVTKFIGGALGDDKGALPVILTIDHDEHLAGFDVAERLSRITGKPAESHPKDIHGSSLVHHSQPGSLAHD
jgi:hypothetical protein